MTHRSILSASGLFVLALAMPAAALSAGPVSVGPFKSIQLRGGGHVVLHHGASQSVTLVKGDARYTGMKVDRNGQLVIDACNADCPHRYDLEIDITTPDIDGVAVSGGGAIEAAKGFPRQSEVAAAVKGGGSIDLRAIEADEVSATVNGGGEILAKAGRALNAAVNGGGAIRYWGKPELRSAVNGGGEITKGDAG